MTGTRNLIAVLTVVAMVTVACGGDAESGGPGTTTQPTSAEPEGDVPDTTETPTTETDATPANEPAAEERGDEDQDTSGLSGEGTFTVNGEETDTEWVVRCAPSDDFGGNPDARDLQLIAYSSEGGFLTLDVGVEDLEGLGENNYTYNTFGLDWGQSVQEVEIDGFRTSPDGDWYFGVDTIQLARRTQTIDPLDPPPFTMEGDRINRQCRHRCDRSQPAGWCDHRVRSVDPTRSVRLLPAVTRREMSRAEGGNE